MSIATKGEKNPFFNKKHSSKTKEIIKQKATNRVLTEETKNKISVSLSGENNYWFGKEFSTEHKKHLSDSARGRLLSETTKNKLRANSPKSIKLYKIINGIEQEFLSLRHAERECGITKKTLSKNFAKYGFFKKL